MSSTKECESNSATRNICTQASLAEIADVARHAERSQDGVVRMIAKPRSFFLERGYLVPLEARVVVRSAEETQARLQFPAGVDEFVDWPDPPVAKIKIHVATGLAKCVSVEFE